jgi:hypothetical protein
MTPGDTLTDDQVQTIRTWLLNGSYGFGSGATSKFENPTLEAKNFTGTCHCETTLICLYLIGHIRDWIPKNAGEDVLKEARMALSIRFQWILKGQTARPDEDVPSHRFSTLQRGTSLPQAGAYISRSRLLVVVERREYPAIPAGKAQWRRGCIKRWIIRYLDAYKERYRDD